MRSPSNFIMHITVCPLVVACTVLSARFVYGGTPCDPNSTAPLIAFSIRQDMSKAREDYEARPVTCTFSVDQESHMNFVTGDNSSTFFVDTPNAVQFGCSEKLKSGFYKQVVPTMQLLSRAFAGTSIKVENCKYAVSAMPMDQAAKTTYTDNTLSTEKKSPRTSATVPTSNTDSSLNLHSNERRLITEALQKANGDTKQASKALGISERALTRKMKEYNLSTSN